MGEAAGWSTQEHRRRVPHQPQWRPGRPVREQLGAGQHPCGLLRGTCWCSHLATCHSSLLCSACSHARSWHRDQATLRLVVLVLGRKARLFSGPGGRSCGKSGHGRNREGCNTGQAAPTSQPPGQGGHKLLSSLKLVWRAGPGSWPSLVLFPPLEARVIKLIETSLWRLAQLHTLALPKTQHHHHRPRRDSLERNMMTEMATSGHRSLFPQQVAVASGHKTRSLKALTLSAWGKVACGFCLSDLVWCWTESLDMSSHTGISPWPHRAKT